MNRSRWGSDDDLLATLGEALQEAAASEHSTAAGRRAWEHRGGGRDLAVADLRFDSCCDDLASVRGNAFVDQRVLAFSTDADQGVELAVVDDGMLGQVLPPGAGEVTLTCETGPTTTATSDRLGCFSLPRPTGPFLIRFRSAAGDVAFTTTWTRL